MKHRMKVVEVENNAADEAGQKTYRTMVRLEPVLSGRVSTVWPVRIDEFLLIDPATSGRVLAGDEFDMEFTPAAKSPDKE